MLRMNALIRIRRCDVIDKTANVRTTSENPFTSVKIYAFKPISKTLSFRMRQLEFTLKIHDFPDFFLIFSRFSGIP